LCAVVLLCVGAVLGGGDDELISANPYFHAFVVLLLQERNSLQQW
jgi:hypothetical protein